MRIVGGGRGRSVQSLLIESVLLIGRRDDGRHRFRAFGESVLDDTLERPWTLSSYKSLVCNLLLGPRNASPVNVFLEGHGRIVSCTKHLSLYGLSAGAQDRMLRVPWVAPLKGEVSHLTHGDVLEEQIYRVKEVGGRAGEEGPGGIEKKRA